MNLDSWERSPLRMSKREHNEWERHMERGKVLRGHAPWYRKAIEEWRRMQRESRSQGQ